MKRTILTLISLSILALPALARPNYTRVQTGPGAHSTTGSGGAGGQFKDQGGTTTVNTGHGNIYTKELPAVPEQP